MYQFNSFDHAIRFLRAKGYVRRAETEGVHWAGVVGATADTWYLDNLMAWGAMPGVNAAIIHTRNTHVNTRIMGHSFGHQAPYDGYLIIPR